MATKAAAPIRHFGPVEVERIFLYEENPRHEPIPSEPEIIEHLCKDEVVFNLARNISESGLNPLELFGIVDLKSGSGSKKSYQVWEGNRRVCALKLLNDPDLAPAHLRKDFKKLAKESAHVPIQKVNAVVFDDHDDLKYWMGIIHGGEQSGVGRRTWDAQQKARHFGSGRNRVALAILDAAENLGLMSKEEREGKITTAQRFLNSSVVREALGIDTSNPDDITFNRPKEEFQAQLGRFITDLKEGEKVTSRHNKPQIDQYGRKLAGASHLTGDRTEAQSLKAVTGGRVKKAKAKKKPKKPRKIINIEYDSDLAKAVGDMSNSKLESLYHSICTVRIDHAPLLTIGAWVFVESLAALAGKGENVDFLAFFSNQRLGQYGFSTSNKVVGPIRDALKRIQTNGNTTKHHGVSAMFDGKQLANDVATITPMLVKTVESIAPKK